MLSFLDRCKGNATWPKCYQHAIAIMADWCDLVEHVSTLKDGGYFVWAFAFKGDAGVPNHKTLLIMYIPDEADARTKMLYAASKEALKETLDCGTLVELQAHNQHHAREHHKHPHTPILTTGSSATLPYQPAW